MKGGLHFVPCETPLTGADVLTLEDQDAVRRAVPASTVGYQDGQLLISRVGVLNMVEEIIAGRTVGNVTAAKLMKAEILRNYPTP